MKKRISTAIFFIGFLLAGFFLFKTAHADTIYIQQLSTGNNFDCTYNLPIYGGGRCGMIFTPSQDFMLTGVIVDVAQFVGQTTSFQIGIFQSDGTQIATSTNTIQSTDLSVYPSFSEATLNFLGVQVSTGVQYIFKILKSEHPYIEATGITYGGSVSQCFIGGNGGDETNTCLGSNQLYFKILGSPPVINSAIISTIATSTATNALNFDYSYHLDSAALFNGTYSAFPYFKLFACSDAYCTQAYQISASWQDFHPNSNIASGTISGGSLQNGFYQIQNFYLKFDSIGNGSLNASTTPVSSNVFNVAYSTTTTIPIITIPVMPTGATSTIGITMTCDPNDAWYAYSLCKLALWLFMPDQAVLNQFGGLVNNIRTKPPLGYFSSISTALYSVGSTSTPAFTIISTTSTDPVNTTFFSPIRTGLIWILWLAFGFWIFERFRHFNLTNP